MNRFLISRYKKAISACLALVLALSLMAAPGDVAAASDAVVNVSSEKQVIRGFGGINHPAWIGDLTAAQRNRIWERAQSVRILDIKNLRARRPKSVVP